MIKTRNQGKLDSTPRVFMFFHNFLLLSLISPPLSHHAEIAAFNIYHWTVSSAFSKPYSVINDEFNPF